MRVCEMYGGYGLCCMYIMYVGSICGVYGVSVYMVCVPVCDVFVSVYGVRDLYACWYVWYAVYGFCLCDVSMRVYQVSYGNQRTAFLKKILFYFYVW